MQTLPEIAFRGFEPAAHVRERVSQEMARLERFHPRMTSARVVVERVTRRRQRAISIRLGSSSFFLAAARSP